MGEQRIPRADGDFATWAEQHFESVEKFWSVKRGQPPTLGLKERIAVLGRMLGFR